ncbi:hypothetical protein B484DRAFT_460383, partial [Ochromonadaceae sp. CCMP2298]
ERARAVDMRAHSRLFHCEIDGCEFICNSKAALEEHEKLPLDKHIIRCIETDLDVIKRGCVKATSEVRHTADLSSAMDVERTDTHIYTAAALIQMSPFAYNPDFQIAQFAQPPPGFARKSNAPQTKMTVPMWNWVLFCQGRGDAAVDAGSTTLGHQAAKAMRYLGTAKGAAIFSSTATDITYMHPPHYPATRTFKMHEILSAQQLKAYMSQDRSKLEATRAAAI